MGKMELALNVLFLILATTVCIRGATGVAVAIQDVAMCMAMIIMYIDRKIGRLK